MKKLVLYFHAGSKNHGCEAIVRTINKILNKKTILYSFNANEDKKYKLDDIVETKQCIFLSLHKNFDLDITTKNKIKNLIKFFIPKFIINYRRILIYKKKFADIINSQENIFLSIGGDNYCYDGYEVLGFINKQLTNQNKKTVLFGCSIEPKDIENNKNLIKDLNRYSLITARESLTYNSLIENGINKNTHLFPDPAFVLDTQETELPNNFLENNTVGINLSPMVQNLEKGNNIAFKNFVELINYILENTNMNVALIPHVVWKNNNDLEPLTKLYNQLKNTNRVCLIDENKTLNAMQLKYIISKCRFLVAARTHASIAAYSTQVPTLVIGYSIKAKGIAKDIFGDYKDYVLPVQNLKETTEVTDTFKKLMQNENDIRQHYKNFMPSYIEKTWLANKEIEKLLNN